MQLAHDRVAIRSSRGPRRSAIRFTLGHEKPSSGFPRRADIRATRFVAEVAASPCGNHLAQVWQVGEGVSPTLDANANVRFLLTEVEGRPTAVE